MMFEEIIRRLRAACLQVPRGVGDLDQSAALWVAAQLGQDPATSSFRVSRVEIDRGRLGEAPYLAALGFLVGAVPAAPVDRSVVKPALQTVLQRQPHTLECGGFADDALVYCGLRLLASWLGDIDAVARLSRADTTALRNAILLEVLAGLSTGQLPPILNPLPAGVADFAGTAILELARRRRGLAPTHSPNAILGGLEKFAGEAANDLESMLLLVVAEALGVAASVAPPLDHGDSADAVDVALIVALREEFRVLHRRIATTATVLEDAGQHYYRFEVPSEQRPYRCIATFIGEMGPGFAGVVTQKLIDRWKPEAVVVVGIAAGLHKDVRVGDVMIANQVDNYMDSTKAVDAPSDAFVLLHGGNSFQVDAALVARVRNFEFRHADVYNAWRDRSAERFAKLPPTAQALPDKVVRSRPELIDGHLASGPVVGASGNFASWLQTRDRNIRALEMESGGTMISAHLSPGTIGIVVRGISDLGDDRKSQLDSIGDGCLRTHAMEAALDLLWSIMSVGVLPRLPAATAKE
jgi:nucleoside phosphorylase